MSKPPQTAERLVQWIRYTRMNLVENDIRGDFCLYLGQEEYMTLKASVEYLNLWDAHHPEKEYFCGYEVIPVRLPSYYRLA